MIFTCIKAMEIENNKVRASASMQNKIQEDKNQRHWDIEQLCKLTGVLAHEIKNPLSTIKINLKLIKEELEDSAETSGVSSAEGDIRFARALRKIAVIQKETDRLENILDSFLRYIDRIEPQLARIDINELVGDMIDFYSPQAYTHSITIRQGLSGQPLICRADAGMLKQAILNLFINAQQAMSQGGELMVRTFGRDNQAVIQISDTGTGIASDKLPRIFDAYHSIKPQGSGLGLPTVKKIMEAHKGAVTVDSELGKGTSFTIKLPLLIEEKDAGEE